jgi:molybdate transport system substrate-binding protein
LTTDTVGADTMRAVWMLAVMGLSLWLGVARAEEPARVFAAASLTSALDEAASAWHARGHPRAVIAYGGSSTLARQIEAGAPVDLFASADRAWMDYLDQRGRLAPETRIDLLGNALVLIAPRDARFAVSMTPAFDFAAAFKGKLCTGEPGVVPVGNYARQALSSLGWWSAIESRIVGTDDVRAALSFVERGECAAGIVYATDARISDRVEVLATFPASAHRAIVYPFALTREARPEARALLMFLRGDEARAIFARHGFATSGF